VERGDEAVRRIDRLVLSHMHAIHEMSHAWVARRNSLGEQHSVPPAFRSCAAPSFDHITHLQAESAASLSVFNEPRSC
jgi:hypothetical protein